MPANCAPIHTGAHVGGNAVRLQHVRETPGRMFGLIARVTSTMPERSRVLL
jgi:hypothetical protein